MMKSSIAWLCLLSSSLLVAEGQEDNQIKTKVGENFDIILSSNPSAGYDWYILTNQPEKYQSFKLVERKFTPDFPGRIGGGGKVKLTFEAIREGEENIILVKKRLWKINSDLEYSRYHVTVEK